MLEQRPLILIILLISLEMSLLLYFLFFVFFLFPCSHSWIRKNGYEFTVYNALNLEVVKTFYLNVVDNIMRC